MKGRRVVVSVYLDPEQKTALDKLSKTTRVPVAAYLREGVDLVLSRYKKQLRGGRKR
ncbi:MAG: ribbon-helix-helix domain-containing protein [Gammaproteobacteria bacterium]